MPISWLWITASKSHTNYLVYMIHNLWCFCEAYFQNRPVTISVALLLINAGYILVTHNWMDIPLQLPCLHYQESLTLCWCSVSGGCDINTNHIVYNGGQTSIIDKCRRTALDYTTCSIQNCWRSVDALLMLIFRRSDIDTNHIFPKGGPYVHYA